MATDWAPVIQTGIGAIAALSGGVAGAWIQGLSQARIERDRRRERIAEVLAEVIKLVRDSDPESLNGSEASKARVEELKNRERAINGHLLILSAGHPSAQVRQLAHRLEDALYAAVLFTWVYVEREAKGPAPDVQEFAEERHAEAERLLAELADAIERG